MTFFDLKKKFSLLFFAFRDFFKGVITIVFHPVQNSAEAHRNRHLKVALCSGPPFFSKKVVKKKSVQKKFPLADFPPFRVFSLVKYLGIFENGQN